ncbi:DUF6049 family protein [Streptomyces sp. AK02-01A]|uniref:DUF6049 family protein n=1 Tax=Streptomyces sp. AK02-01A TaxID=3028648 RepID=UPI0029B88E72|nr:DUF6049 family protein [Streptomyces sp. AK02-01A]MDX3852936.1 DUF6049 family protein [Streptomyces sp. AK02-01A]
MAEAADFQGTGHSPARRRLRRTASLIAGAPLLAGLVAGAATPAAHAAPAAVTATGSRTVDVSLDTLTPSAPVKGDTLTVSGTVTNEGKKTITHAQVDLRVGPRLSGRTAIDDAAERSGNASGAVAPIGGTYKVTFPKLTTGIPQDFSLSVPVSKLGLDEDGVYQLGVSLTGQTSSAPYDQVLGMRRTFLPWQPEATEKKTQLTTLWPLISTTHLSAETGSDDQQTPVFENDDLATELATGGRLEQMVSLGNELPVTWVIDPDLLATADAMTRDYRVRSGKSTIPGKHQAVANQWLNALEKAVQGRKVIALPFADPDLASLAHRGKDSGALSHLQPATDVAGKTVETILHQKPSVDFAWPVDGAIDPSIVDVATSAGAHKVITRSDSLQDNLPYTPSAARPIGGGTTAVVADTRLSTAFQSDMTSAGSSTLAVQKFLAQTLALTLQVPDNERSIVVAPQRMPTAAQAQSMARALHGLDPERWTEPADLIAAAAARPDDDATTKVPSSSRYPRKLRGQELPSEAFGEIRGTQDRLDNFKAILSSPDRVAAPFANAIDRAMSTSWRGEPDGAQRYRNIVDNYLLGLTAEVQLIEKSVLTLSGRSATIPVTVQNQLLQGVENLVLRLKSDNPTRLKIDGDRTVAERPIKIDGGHSQSVKFTGAGNANGPVQVTAQLYTVDGKPYGDSMTFQVKVSEVTPTVMLVIAGGVLLLVLAGVKMYSQRKRAVARKAAGGPTDDRAEAGGAQDTDGEPAPEDTDSEQPSDLTPDTGPESGDPSGAGEKVDR